MGNEQVGAGLLTRTKRDDSEAGRCRVGSYPRGRDLYQGWWGRKTGEDEGGEKQMIWTKCGVVSQENR